MNAEPEILTWQINSLDKYIIIASDGVFEFLTSQAVVDIIKSYDNILEGCKHVVEESYRLWLTYDDRTDDITIIVIKIDHVTLKVGAIPPPSMNKQLSTSTAAAHQLQLENKPVRRIMSKARRKDITEHWVNQEIADFDFNKNATPKVSSTFYYFYLFC